MSIETEKWMQSHDAVWVDAPGRELVAECRSSDAARAVAVLPEALAALKDAANYELEDGLCWCMAPCHPGRPDPDCARNRDILQRAGVLK